MDTIDHPPPFQYPPPENQTVEEVITSTVRDLTIDNSTTSMETTTLSQFISQTPQQEIPTLLPKLIETTTENLETTTGNIETVETSSFNFMNNMFNDTFESTTVSSNGEDNDALYIIFGVLAAIVLLITVVLILVYKKVKCAELRSRSGGYCVNDLKASTPQNARPTTKPYGFPDAEIKL